MQYGFFKAIFFVGSCKKWFCNLFLNTHTVKEGVLKCCFHKASAQKLFFLHFIYFGELQKQCQNQLSCLSRIIIICNIIFFCLNGAFCQSLLIRFVKRQRTWFTVVDQNDKNWGTCLFPFMKLPHLWADLFAKKFPSLSHPW